MQNNLRINKEREAETFLYFLTVELWYNPPIRGKVQKKAYSSHRYTYRVLQTNQMKHILLCVWAEPAILEIG